MVSAKLILEKGRIGKRGKRGFQGFPGPESLANPFFLLEKRKRSGKVEKEKRVGVFVGLGEGEG